MKKTLCDKCKIEVSNANYKRHYLSCNGSGPYRPLKSCLWCNLIFDEIVNRPNHIRWCKENPRRNEYQTTNNGVQLRTPEAIEKRKIGIKQAHKDGKYIESNKRKLGKPGFKHTDKTKQHLREKALASPHRRLLRSVRDYIKKDGTIVKLDSSWEEELARRLDFLDIEWVRPKPIKWIDKNGIARNYFPDFYLPKFELYLDPKNDQAYRVQKDKIDCLHDQIPNLQIIRTLEECKNYKL